MSAVGERAYGPSAAASVVLNLGADIGALIIEAGVGQLGLEIEISREADAESDAGTGSAGRAAGKAAEKAVRTHSMVRERLTHPESSYDAVYPDLRAGVYTVWRDDETSAAQVTVVGGEIARLVWS